MIYNVLGCQFSLDVKTYFYGDLRCQHG